MKHINMQRKLIAARNINYKFQCIFLHSDYHESLFNYYNKIISSSTRHRYEMVQFCYQFNFIFYISWN